MNVNRIAVLTLFVLLSACAAPHLNRVDADNAARQRLSGPAEQGDAQAQYELGTTYCCGEGFYDTAEAIKWWCRAATQGHALASRKLRAHLAATGDLSECEKYAKPDEIRSELVSVESIFFCELLAHGFDE